ncbi:hypothetical protein [Caenimonas aquaedulcis]|uniref:DUF4230 domain-containing protein n=1 Tax=Caenimonas aquaedulcis TaxID=2793270 RepID=A0A931H374_9BURK|nr:hypothetical protein [Caenimonas aquaedulcis]MBG9387756.1 hypothetical protein [Caenimonas aquaedulcis]
MADPRRAPGYLLLFAAALVVAGWFAYDRYVAPHSAVGTSVLGSGIPVVMRSPGGLLEISTVTVYERFRRTDTKDMLGIPLGTTVSIIQVPVTYRYHIEMAKEWPIYLNGKTALVRAGEVHPSLPVAIDTSKMEKFTQSGWARFNKDENLELLEKSITPQLQLRAELPAVRQLAMDAGRQTVREFVTTWLLKEQGWKQGDGGKVIVLFPGEPVPRAGADPG